MRYTVIRKCMLQLLVDVNDMTQDIYKDLLPLDTTFAHGGMEMKLALYTMKHRIISLHEIFMQEI